MARRKCLSMSISSRLDRALHRLGWIVRRLPASDVGRTAELVHLISQDNADGRAYRHAVRFWHPGMRPIVERIAGNDAWLEVEGPCCISHGLDYALGSQIYHKTRWYQLYPRETNALAFELRAAIDEVLAGWVINHPTTAYDYDYRGQRNREIDDRASRELIAADSRSRRSEEHGSHD